jgi:transposase
MRRYALRDDQWDRIKDILPGRERHVGVTAKDNRLFVEAVFYRYRAAWRDLPERFGDPIKIYMRFSRWAKGSAWKKIFEMLAADADNEYAMIDSTIVRHISTAPALKKRRRRPGDRAQQRRIEHQNPCQGRRPRQSAGLLPDCGSSP